MTLDSRQSESGEIALRKLHPPYRDTFDLRLDASHIEAMRGLLRWLDPGAVFPGGTRRTSLDLDRLVEIQEALRDA